jgi:type II secretory pathway pseudopilin PulG
MTEKDTEVTQPVPKKKKKKDKKKFFQRRFSWYMIGLLIAILIVAAGALLGIPRGINDRVQLAEAQAAPKIQAQLESAKLDIEEGRYEVAMGRLDWILDEMSPYLTDAELTEVGDLYSQVLLMVNASGTATPAPSPTPTMPDYTPTPDLRGEEDLFTTAEQLITAESWDEAIQTLEALREKSLTYKSIEVDGMFYIALRNRGLQKILTDGSLEPGIYDLTLAEQFAPLDSTAEGIRTWARLYLTGASYWGVDWSQVVYYFEQVYPALPNLRDGTGMTATERFRQAAIQYGSQLAAQKKWCEAQEYFDKAMAIGADPEAQPTANWVAEKCWAKQHPPTTQPPEPTPTPSPTGEPTTETPPTETTEAP